MMQFSLPRLLAFSAAGFVYGISSVADASRTNQSSRISHAKELLGDRYELTLFKRAEKIEDISNLVESLTRELLPKIAKKKARAIATAILGESDRYSFDPLFTMAVIQNESSFRPSQKGGHGEIGLLQIKPSTAYWIAKKYKIPLKKAEKDLLDPVMNVRIGLAYWSELRSNFKSHSRLYISAYNMGPKRVRELVEKSRMPKEYVKAVMKRYYAFYKAFLMKEINRQTKEALKNLKLVTQAADAAPIDVKDI